MGSPSDRKQVSLAALERHAQRHGKPWDDPALAQTPDLNRRFTADSLCPLAHAPLWPTLGERQRRRYNQLVGLYQNELTVMFETGIAATVLPRLIGDHALPAELRSALATFLEDERQHTAAFRALNHAAAPSWYEGGDFHILQLPAALAAGFRQITKRPGKFPFLFWMMLIMEERSLMISRRIAAEEDVCPRWAAVFRAHLIDEVRHVQTDWHLLDRFWQTRSHLTRQANAWLLRATVLGLFLKPGRANVRLVDLLIADFPDLASRRAELVAAVRKLGGAAGYRTMMYSPESAPITCKLFGELPELRGLWPRMAHA